MNFPKTMKSIQVEKKEKICTYVYVSKMSCCRKPLHFIVDKTKQNKTKTTKHPLKPVQIANIVIPLDGQQGETMKHLQQILFIVENYSHTHFTAATAIHK